MTKGTLDLPGSRELIATLVADYEAAMESESARRFLKAREKLDRWLWPLARWYLDHTEPDGE